MSTVLRMRGWLRRPEAVLAHERLGHGAIPTWPHSRDWGYGPTGGLGLVLLIGWCCYRWGACRPYRLAWAVRSQAVSTLNVNRISCMAFKEGRWDDLGP